MVCSDSKIGAETVRVGVQSALGMKSQATMDHAMRLTKELC